MRRLLFGALAIILVATAAIGVMKVLSVQRPGFEQRIPRLFTAPTIPQPLRMPRPYGMAPVAYQAFLRACQQSGIHPFRIGQTIGDHPRSAGYHKRDGVLFVEKQRVDYCAAVDLGTCDLPPQKINQFVEALAQQGFAAWYRSGPKWKNGEHIHAIYAFLPMKPQLQSQLRDFLRERRRTGRSPQWRAKLRSQEDKLKHWMVW